LNYNLYQLCFGVFAGPDLPQETIGAAMVPTPDGTGVILIGGRHTLKDLYELKCTLLGCQWSLMEKQLSLERFYSVAFLVPDSFVVCEH
jgi:hypothetical protein